MEPIRKNWQIIAFILGVIVIAVQFQSAVARNAEDIKVLQQVDAKFEQVDRANETNINSINTQLLVYMADISVRLRNLEKVNGISSAPLPTPFTPLQSTQQVK